MDHFPWRCLIISLAQKLRSHTSGRNLHSLSPATAHHVASRARFEWGRALVIQKGHALGHFFLKGDFFLQSQPGFIQLDIQPVGGLEHFLLFHIVGIITPTDYFFRGVETTNQT